MSSIFLYDSDIDVEMNHGGCLSAQTDVEVEVEVM
jgi:hypothetical protein